MNNIVKVRISDFYFLFTMNCLVCIKTISAFADTLTGDDKSNIEKTEKAFKEYCKKVKVDSKEHRLVNRKFLILFQIKSI